MEKDILNTENLQTESVENTPVVENADFYAGDDVQSTPEKDYQKSDIKGIDFKFFRNCAASLKKFSILVFVINIFVAVGITGAATVLLAVNLGTQMLSLLALPLITLFVILIILARFVSALIYGFAEIVEKAEKN